VTGFPEVFNILFESQNPHTLNRLGHPRRGSEMCGRFLIPKTPLEVTTGWLWFAEENLAAADGKETSTPSG
jgi:hypothetical protein